MSETSAKSIVEGETIKLKIETKDNQHALPTDVSVGNATQVLYNPNTGELTISNPIGNVTINGNCRQIFNIKGNITNGSLSSGDPTTIIEDESTTLNITANDGFNLPTEVNVDGATKGSYDSDTGILLISNPKGDVTITGNCTRKDFTISYNINDGTLEGQTSIEYEGQAELQIIPNDRYSLPNSTEDITIENAEIIDYDNSTGKLTIAKARGDVTITATCPYIPSYDIYYNFEGNTVKEDTTRPAWIRKEGETLTIKFEPLDGRYGWVQDKSDSFINVEGAESSYTVTNNIITLTISNPADRVGIKLSYSKIAYSVTCDAEGVLIEEYFPINQASGIKTINIKRSQEAIDDGLYLPASIDQTRFDIKEANYVEGSYTVVDTGEQRRCSATIQIRDIGGDVVIGGFSQFVYAQTILQFTNPTNCDYKCLNTTDSDHYWIFSDELERKLTFRITPVSGYSIQKDRTVIITDDKGVQRGSEMLTWDSEDTFTLSNWTKGIFYIRLFCYK